MVSVKLCGLRRPADVAVCHEADALGFIVEIPRSRRSLDRDEAKRLLELCDSSIETVVVTDLTSPERLAELARTLRPGALQLHGGAPPSELAAIRAALPVGVRLIAVLPVDSDDAQLMEQARRLAKAPIDRLLLDSSLGSISGGTGTRHDWRLSRLIRDEVAPLPVVLAGGLAPENVREAIEAVEPYGVDVSSGIERDGVKDPELVARFIAAARER